MGKQINGTENAQKAQGACEQAGGKTEQNNTNGALESAAMMAMFMHRPFDRKAVALRVDKPMCDLGPEDVLVILEASGLKGKRKKESWNRLKNRRVPVILELDNRRFIVFVRANGDKVLVKTPGSRSTQELGKAELERVWTGRLIEVNAPDEPEAEAGKFGLGWFLGAVSKYKSVLRDIVLASLFVQLFALVTPLMFQIVIDKVLTHRSMSTLDVLMFALVMVSLFDVVLGGLRNYAVAHTGNKLDLELGSRLFDRLIRLPIGFFHSRPVGDIIARMKELDIVRGFLTGSAITLLIDVLFTVVFLGVMFYYSATLTLVVMFTIPLFLGITILLAPLMRRGMEDQFAIGARNQSFLVEAISGIESIKAGTAERGMQKKWDDRLTRHVNTAFQSGQIANITNQLVNLVSKGSVVLVLWLGTRMVLEGQLTVGQLIAFNMLTARVNAPILRIANLWQDIERVKVSLGRLGDIMSVSPEPAHLPGKTVPTKVDGRLSFEHVHFSYASDQLPVLDDISFEIQPGEVVGIVGSSGSGKSTLARLVQRFYVPQRGSVMIDGHDLALLDAAWIRRVVGVVPQDAVLFNISVRENIAMGRPTASADEIMAVAKMVGAHDFIIGLPDGYDSIIGERGARLSAGQRQRIAIARALIGNPRILILDEATSALDSESEMILQRNMRRICEGRTVIIIAHRLATIRNADRILALEKGRIVEEGTHDELIDAGGRYAHLHAIQEGMHEVA